MMTIPARRRRIFYTYNTRFFLHWTFGHIPTCIVMDPFVDAIWIPCDRLQQTLV